jgi:hypothetical protein
MLIKASFILQFTGAKINTISAAISLAIMISIKWHISFPIAILCVAAFSFAICGFVYFSGWMHAEQEYVGKLLNLREKK